jgi:hypothetical protein
MKESEGICTSLDTAASNFASDKFVKASLIEFRCVSGSYEFHAQHIK